MDPVTEADDLVWQDGWLLVPPSGSPITDEEVQALRVADQRRVPIDHDVTG